MARITMPVLLGATLFLSPSIADAQAPGEKKLSRAQAEMFAERVGEVIEGVAEQYVIPIDRAQLVRWAVLGLYDRVDLHGPPAELRERLDNLGSIDDKGVRAFMTDVGMELQGEVGRCTELALERMLRHLDEQTRIVGCSKIIIDYRYYPVGIGITLAHDAGSDMIRVATVILDGPAYKAGLRTGDVITQITLLANREPGEKPGVLSTKGMKVAHATQEIAGKEDTRVRLTVQRAGTARPLEFEAIRARTEVEPALGVRRGSDDHWDYWLDHDRKIAYLRPGRFEQNTAAAVGKVVSGLRKQGLRSLVLDLRFHQGPLVSTSVKLAGLFVGDSPVVLIRSHVGEVKYRGKAEGSETDFPMVCLVDRDTARMAEVVAACLQDNQRAVVLGERTQG